MNNKLLLAIAVILAILGTAKLLVTYNAQTGKSSTTNVVKNNLKILIYSKSTCMYCVRAKDLLDKNSIPYQMIDLSNNVDLHQKLAAKTGQNTVPYVFVNDQFVGGFNQLKSMEESGQFYEKLSIHDRSTK
jgi:glutaredoxin 3